MSTAACSPKGAWPGQIPGTGSGQCPVKRYNQWLRDLIIRGQARPSQVISHELPLDKAGYAYEQFDSRADGWTKVILHPGKNA